MRCCGPVAGRWCWCSPIPTAAPCTALLPDVGRWQRDCAEEIEISVISRGAARDNRAKTVEHGVYGVLLQRDFEVATAYRMPATPSAALVRPDGTVGSPVAMGPGQIANCGPPRGLPAEPPADVPSGVGEPAPELDLPGLDGERVRLSDFAGRQTMVLFWNPGCGFCQQMLDDLREWESDPPASAPGLLVVSTATAEENAAMELRSPVVLEDGFATARVFGASGTPSAVPVDSEGGIASKPAVGAPEVLELARGRAVLQVHRG